MYKFDKIIVQMTITVQISDFRNNISDYIDQMITSQGIINVKRGNVLVAKVFPQVKDKKVNMAENILKDLDIIRKKVKLKTEAKDMEELVNEIDRIAYGIDRNGRELSSR